jgi:hypothetical protein
MVKTFTIFIGKFSFEKIKKKIKKNPLKVPTPVMSSMEEMPSRRGTVK